MEIRSFNSELGIANLIFKRIFNNIRIERFDAQGKKKDIVVNCQFGQRSRIIKSWQNAERQATIKLPLILINRRGYTRDSARVNNLHNEVKYEITDRKRIYDWLTPVPIDISYEVTVISKYQSDIDQIASNFMVFFNASTYVSCVHPKYDGIKLNNRVIMDDGVSEDHPEEIDAGSDDFITSSFQFTFKTFLFAGNKQAKKVPAKVLSSHTETVVSSNVIALTSESAIQQFLVEHPGAILSGELTSLATTTVTSYVDNPEISDNVFDDFAPVITQIDIGFYPVPMVSSIAEHINVVDTTYPDYKQDISAYISSTSYTPHYGDVVDVEGNAHEQLTSLTPDDMIYDTVDTSGSIYPFADRLVWKINSESSADIPNNIYLYRK